MATAMNKRAQVEQEMMEAFGLVPEWSKTIPESAIEGFWATMRDFQLAQTTIPNKYKELIGLACPAPRGAATARCSTRRRPG